MRKGSIQVSVNILVVMIIGLALLGVGVPAYIPMVPSISPPGDSEKEPSGVPKAANPFLTWSLGYQDGDI